MCPPSSRFGFDEQPKRQPERTSSKKEQPDEIELVARLRSFLFDLL